ncbi:MAG: hypothetical protein LBL76_07100 [Treponema sp.]|jgi:hypothetical protein|nr:hypothetical protein [Treponema sp.]
MSSFWLVSKLLEADKFLKSYLFQGGHLVSTDYIDDLDVGATYRFEFSKVKRDLNLSVEGKLLILSKLEMVSGGKIQLVLSHADTEVTFVIPLEVYYEWVTDFPEDFALGTSFELSVVETEELQESDKAFM